MFSDHEGGNVAAHATHLINSALSDPYLAFSAGLNGLAGPLHGLANQEVLKFILKFQEKYGKRWTDQDLREYCKKTLDDGQLIPGYGHAVLRQTDPRFLCEMEFAHRYIKNDNLIDIVKAGYRVIPDVLLQTEKVTNVWPNIDAGSGALLWHYGMREIEYYTVLFGVSRAFGVMASSVWSRALNLPIERPNSVTLDYLMKKVKNEF